MNSATPNQALTQRIDAVLERTYRTGEVAVDGGGRASIKPAGMRRDQGEAMAAVLNRVGAQRTLETGFALGLSGLFMLRAALENGADPYAGAVHTALDPFQALNWRRAGLRLFADAGVSHLLRFVEARSELCLPKLIEAGEQFDALLVDGDHRFEAAFVDLLFGTRLVRPGGVLLVDDVWMPSVRAAIDYFTTNVGLVHEVEGPAGAAHTFAVLRVPEALPGRNWDHYIPFDAGQRSSALV